MIHPRKHACLGRAILLACMFSGPVSAASEALPLTVTPGLGSLEWVVTNTGGTDSGKAFEGSCDGSPGMTISEATTASGATDAYDNAWMLFVDGIVFEAPATVDLSGETLTAGPVDLSGLNTSVEILFPGSIQAARILVLFENPTDSAITVDVDIPVNLGSDGDTLVEQTSSNDTVFTETDRWIVTSDNGVGLKAVNTTVIYGPGDPEATPLAVTGSVCKDSVDHSEGIGFSFSITVPANKTRSLMFFAGLGSIQGTSNTITGAIANAAMFNSNNDIDTRLLTGLSVTDQLNILNWDFAATIDDNTVAAEEDRTIIDDFIGCSLGSGRANDPVLPLLVLLALAGLVRTRIRP